jgi:hypothetical protein
MVPLGFLEITVKNEVPTRMFLLGTLFLTVISRKPGELVSYNIL